jgi:1,4-alpha-glucan branching enzyme
MMVDEHLKEKYIAHLDGMIKLGLSECERTSGSGELNMLAQKYLRHYEHTRRYFTQREGNLPAAFAALSRRGRLELMTTSATHGFLPLVHMKECRRAQIEVGLNFFQEIFGHRAAGFWLPECAYDEGLDVLLKDAGVKYFIVDTHGIMASNPVPVNGIYGPVRCRSGVAAFGRDPESSRQVWERREGYPGHPDYREFYRDIAYDLDIDYIGPFLPGGAIRVDTGYKYYRITGGGGDKELYNPAAAAKRAEMHARDFVARRALQLSQASAGMERMPLVLSPYDAELFGHWWYEGPLWIEQVFRLAGHGGVKAITPGDYLSLHPDSQVVEMPMSTWGEGGYGYVWLNPKNDWIYKHQHFAESKMNDLADRAGSGGGVDKRALSQAGRELLLAQSSDWAFIIKEGTTVEYATRRVTGHLKNFMALAGQIESGSVDTDFLIRLESENTIFPNLDPGIFASLKVTPGIFREANLRVAMLSWEYPPRTVGGLGRHVYDLSRSLSGLGVEVHVFTCPAQDRPPYEVDEAGVHVYRVAEGDLKTGNFLEWLAKLNLGMVRLAWERGLGEGYFTLVHAHDWLVFDAAREIMNKGGIPLVSTIHATEYGRNRGIVTDFQRKIHGIESELVAISQQVICCSNYMAREVGRLFGGGRGGIRVIPNGVNVKNLIPLEEAGDEMAGGPVIAFLGRLVPEKGVQVLIEALPEIRGRHPGVKLAVAGKGPYEDQLKRLAMEKGVQDCVDFIGFVDDRGRNRLLARAAVAVFPSIYEPFGIVALEAMAAGTPVVVSETGGLSEIISHGIDGLKVPPGNPGILARYVADLLAHPARAQRLSRNAYRKVQGRYSWDQIASETAGTYLEVISRAAAASAKKNQRGSVLY